MIESRKKDHMEICLEKDVDAGRNYWKDIKFIHNSAPEIDMDDIGLGVKFLGKSLDAPIMIAGMTGGYDEAGDFNERLASAAEKAGIGLGVGSQRAALEKESLRASYEPISKHSPPLVFGNIGAPQLISQEGEEPYGPSEAREALEMIDGDHLAVHFNYLQEAVQPEGDLKAKGVLDALEKLSEDVPTIAKETGAGVSSRTAKRFQDAGVKAIDVGGLGGTSFSAVEHYRNKDETMKKISKNLWNWGIPTPASIANCRDSVSIPLIATGGVRNGIQIAKALSMGADIVGIAGEALRHLDDGDRSLRKYLDRLKKELKTVMFLLGCSEIEELLNQKKIITRELGDWME